MFSRKVASMNFTLIFSENVSPMQQIVLYFPEFYSFTISQFSNPDCVFVSIDDPTFNYIGNCYPEGVSIKAFVNAIVLARKRYYFYIKKVLQPENFSPNTFIYYFTVVSTDLANVLQRSFTYTANFKTPIIKNQTTQIYT